MKKEGFNLTFDDDNNMKIVYTGFIEDTIQLDNDLIEKIQLLSKNHNVSVMKYFSDTLQIEMIKKLDLHIQQDFNEVIEEQYQLMKEKQKEDITKE